MQLAELFVGISVLSDIRSLVSVQKNFTSATRLAYGLKDAVSALVYALTKLTSSAITSAIELNNLSIQTNISIDALQRLKYLAGQNFISFNSLKGALLGIQQAVASIRLGQGNIRPWALLGINPLQDPVAILEQLKSKLKGLPNGIAINLLGQMGISPEILVYLKTANGYFDKFTKYFILTNKETSNILYLSRAFKDLAFSIKGAGARLVAINFEPIAKFARAIKNSVTALFLFYKWLSKIYEKFDSIKLLFAAGFTGGILLFLLSGNPFLMLIGALTVLMLLLDDLMVYFTGSGKSVTGWLVEQLPKLWAKFKNPLEPWVKSMDSIVDGFKYIEKVLDKMGVFKEIKFIYDSLLGRGSKEAREKAVQTRYKYFTQSGIFTEFGTPYLTKGLKKVLNFLDDKVKDSFTKLYIPSYNKNPEFKTIEERAQTGEIYEFALNKLKESGAFYSNNPYVTNNNIKIDVRSDNPKEAGKNVIEAIKKEQKKQNKLTYGKGSYNG